jgi:DNA-binding NarL/FixJ family response regulator
MLRATPSAPPRARLVLGDDHLLLLDAFRKLLEPEFTVVRTVTDGHAIVAAADELRPDAVVCDVSMPGLSGLEAGKRIRERHPTIRVLYLTMHSDPALACEAMNGGGSAYVLKSSAASELVTALRSALAGGTYLDPALAVERPALLKRAADAVEHVRLSPREQHVLQLLAEGRTMKEVAAALGITPRTVAFHKYRLMRELAVRSSAELVQFAVRRRLV